MALLEDISPQTSLIDTAQPEAIKNIQDGQMLGVEPDFIKNNRDKFRTEMNQIEFPQYATPNVAETMARSPQYAAAIAPDAKKLSVYEQIWDDIVTKTQNKVGPEQELNRLYRKKLDQKGVLDENDDMDMLSLKDQLANKPQPESHEDLGFFGNLPGDIVSTVADMGALAFRHKELIGKIAGAEALVVGAGNAAIGAGAGVLVAGGGALPGAGVGFGVGALRGAVTGLGHGYLAASVYDAFETSRGAIYQGLDDAKDAKGSPLNISEDNKRYISNGLGLLSGAVTAGTTALLMKNIPILKNFIGKPGSTKVAEIISDTGNATFKEALIGLGKSMSIMGGASGIQKMISVLGEELGKTEDGESSLSVANGILNSLKRFEDPEFVKQFGKEVATGALVGGVLHAGFAATQKGIDTAFGLKPVRPGDNAKTVTPITPEAPAGEPGVMVNPEPPPRPSGPATQAIEVLKFQDAIDASSKVLQDTNLHKQHKGMASNIRQQIVKGVRSLYMDSDGVSKFSVNPEQAEALRNIVDPSGIAAMKLNAPVRIDTHKALELHDKYPTLSEYLKLSPQGPSPSQAIEWYNKFEQSQTKRQEFQNKLSIGEKSPEERAATLSINSTMTDPEIANNIGTKEVADALVTLLDSKDLQVKEEFKNNKPEMVRQLEDTDKMRQRIVKMKETLPDDVTAKQVMEKALTTLEPENKVFNEPDFMNAETLTPLIEGLLPKKEVERFNKSVQDTRARISKEIKDSAHLEMEKIVDITIDEATEAQKEIETQRVLDDPNLTVVDKFHTAGAEFYKTSRYNKESDMIGAHHKKGYSPFAIDPRLLTEKQSKKYLENEQLKKHKVFVKGGMKPDDAAALLGANGGDNLLELLANTKTRQEVIDDNVAKRAKEIEDLSRRSVNLNETALADAYHTAAEKTLEIARTVIDLHNNRAVTRAGIKRVAIPLPKSQELVRQAKLAVSQVRVGDLNAKQFDIGAGKSQRIAVDSYTAGKIEKFAVNKINEALNLELAKETRIAIGEVNRVKRLVKRLKKPGAVEELRKAGAYKAVEALYDIYNLSPSSKKQGDINEYKKYIERQIKQGNANPGEIPEAFDDTRTSFMDMTVEEVKAVGDKLTIISHLAKYKNRLYQKYGKPAQDAAAFEGLVNYLHEYSSGENAAGEKVGEPHPDYNLKKTVKPINRTGIDAVKNLALNMTAMIENMEHILVDVDKGQVAGPYHQVIMAPLKGTGEFVDSGQAYKSRMAIDNAKHFEKIIDQYNGHEIGFFEKHGKLDPWNELKTTNVFIPEFEKNDNLNNGHLTQWNLFKILLNMGNSSNSERMVKGWAFTDASGKIVEGSGVDLETVKAIINREVPAKLVKAAQQVWDMYKSYQKPVAELWKEISGMDMSDKMIEGEAFTHTDKETGVTTVYPGGYYPLVSESEMSIDALRRRSDRALDTALGEKKIDLTNNHYSEDMTTHRHREERTKNSRPIDLTGDLGMPMEMIIHDLAFNKPIRDALKILTDPKISKDIVASAGLPAYNVLMNTVVDLSGSVQMENQLAFNSTNMFERLRAHVRNVRSVGYIVGRGASIAIQTGSLPFALERMGARGVQHVLDIANIMATNPLKIGEFYKLAGEIHPSIQDFRQGLDDNTLDSLHKLMPIEKTKIERLTTLKVGEKPTVVADAIRQLTVELGFRTLGEMDQFLKVVIAVSSYSQFMTGDAEGFPYEKVMAMSEKERDSQAKIYASSVTRLTLTTGDQMDRNEFQKRYKELSMFMNDPRNVINNFIRFGRETRWYAKDKDYGTAAYATLGMLGAVVAAKLLEDLIRGNETPLTGIKNKTARRMVKDTAKYVALAGPLKFAGDTPILRELLWAGQTDMMTAKHGYKMNAKVTTPEIQAATDIVQGVEGALIAMGMIRSHLDKPKVKGMMFTASLLTGPLPVNALFDAYSGMRKTMKGKLGPSLVDRYMKELQSFKKDMGAHVFPETMRYFEDLGAQISSPKTGAIDNQNSEAKD